MIVKVEADIIQMRTQKGKQVARAEGWLCGKKPRLCPAQQKHRVALYGSREDTTTDFADTSGAAQSIVYQAVERAGKQ